VAGCAVEEVRMRIEGVGSGVHARSSAPVLPALSVNLTLSLLFLPDGRTHTLDMSRSSTKQHLPCWKTYTGCPIRDAHSVTEYHIVD
jgi:hypothetical protein